MSNPLPALTEAYHTRGNVPIGSNNTTATLIAQWVLWALKAHLVGEHAAGDVGANARNSNSLWTVVQSCDGVSVSASDLWGSTFNAAKIVRASSGTAHSWIVLRNAANGYDLCIDCNSTTFGACQITAVKTTQGFAGGSTTTRPQASGNLEEWSPYTRAVGATQFVTLHADQTLGVQHYAHFATNADGSRWWFGTSRSTSGVVNGWFAFWKGANGRAGDTRNQWWLCGGSAPTGRGVPTAVNLGNATGATRRGLSNATPPLAGIRSWLFGNTALSGVDPDTSEYLAGQLDVAIADTSPAPSGYLPDLHFISGGAIASAVPSTAAQVRTIVGDLVVPCGVPLTV